MPWNLISTKYHRPSIPAKYIPRPHLDRRLNEGLDADCQLTLVSAPPGFGKTTCVNAWIDQLDNSVAWLSLDSSDDDPVRFFSYFITALQQAEIKLGKEIEGILSSGLSLPPESIATTLINHLQSEERKILFIMDDFHVIQEPVILRFMESVIANQPRQLHLILITREDPALPLARLRVSNRMTEIRASDLRFNNLETGMFMQEVVDLSVSPEDIKILEDRTEGWIAGLQLAGISMRGRNDVSSYIAAFSGSHRHVINYLTEEVFNRQPEEVQRFLLQTSILSRLNGELCDVVTERTGSSALLEHLFTSNLFLVSLDDEQCWYRYHHLFAELLRSLLQRARKDEVKDLHRRASQWYASEGLVFEAIEHALAAQDFVFAVELIENHAPDLISQGYVKTVENWNKAIPPEWHSKSLRMNLILAETYFLRNNFQMALHYLLQSEPSLFTKDTEAQTVTPEIQSQQARWMALRTNLLNIENKPAEAISMAQQVIKSVQPDNSDALGFAYLAMGGAYRVTDEYPKLVEVYQKAIHHSYIAGNYLSEFLSASALVLVSIKHGKLHFAEQIASRLVQQFDLVSNPPPIAGPIYGTLGMIYHEWNRLVEARGLYQRGLQMSQFSGHNSGVVFTLLLLVRLTETEGDLATSSQLLQSALDLVPQGITSWIKPEVTLQQAHTWIAQGKLFEVDSLLRELGIDWSGEIQQDQELYFLAYLQWMLSSAKGKDRQEDLIRGVSIADKLIEQSIRGGRIYIALQGLLLRARIHILQNERARALNDVSHAVELAEPEGFIRSFVDAGPEIASLIKENLTRNKWNDQSVVYMNTILAAFFGNGEDAKDREQSIEPPLIEALTEREMEVLRLIADGLKYEEIAQQLIISLNTVRFYIKEIYGKLQVNNRSRAIDTARKLKLL